MLDMSEYYASNCYGCLLYLNLELVVFDMCKKYTDVQIDDTFVRKSWR